VYRYATLAHVVCNIPETHTTYIASMQCVWSNSNTVHKTVQYHITHMKVSEIYQPTTWSAARWFHLDGREWAQWASKYHEV